MKKHLIGGVTLTQFAAYNDELTPSEMADSITGGAANPGGPLTFDQKMKQRESTEGYQNRKPNITIPGGIYKKPNCMSREEYAKLNPNFDRSEQLNKLQEKNV